jgi:hypothetical protein
MNASSPQRWRNQRRKDNEITSRCRLQTKEGRSDSLWSQVDSGCTRFSSQENMSSSATGMPKTSNSSRSVVPNPDVASGYRDELDGEQALSDQNRSARHRQPHAQGFPPSLQRQADFPDEKG